MGDTCCDEHSMGKVAKLIQQELGVHVYSVELGPSTQKDREAGFLGDVNAQVKQVCEDLARDEEIVKAGAYNVVGFSQGGQFARALVQVCPTLETNSKKGMMPRANRLVSFGGQHQGVMEWPGCGDTMTDFFCTTLRGLMALGAYSDLVRKRLVQAQYFKDPLRYQEYLDKNIFLPYLNNEVEEKRNEAYADNLKALDLMVLYMWKQDETVVPRESSLFGVYNATTKSIQQLRDQDLYKEDWIGLKSLDGQGKLVMEEIEGHHMQIDFDWFNQTVVHSILS